MVNWLKTAISTAVGGAIVVGVLNIWGPSQAASETRPDGEAQSNTSDPPELVQNRRRLTIQRTGMLTLLGWAAANIGVGAYGWPTTDGRTKYFHQMNLFWNGVNAVIGGFGYAGAVGEDPRRLDRIETIEKTRSIQQILAFNAGLDLAYVAGGAWLRQRGDHGDDPQLIGYGESIILQGGFLFLFDVALWAFHQDAIGDYKAAIRPGSDGRPGATLTIDF